MEKLKIAMLAPAYFCEAVKEIDARYHTGISQKYDLHYLVCEDREKMRKVYEENCEEMDGFCVAGDFTKRMLIQLLGRATKRPIESLLARSSEYYQEFFRLIDRDRSLDLSRVFIDAAFWGGSSVPRTAADFVRGNRMLGEIRSELLDKMTVEAIQNMDRLILERATEVYENGEADIFVCRAANAYPLLKEAGLPCSFVYPSADTIVSTLKLLASHISLRRLADDLPAAVCIRAAARGAGVLESIDTDSLDIQKAIFEYDRERLAGFVIRQIPGGCEVYTTRQMLRRMTEDQTSCELRRFITERFGVQVCIGYGFGQTITDARGHAYEACEISEKRGGSFLMADDGTLIGPLDEGATLSVGGSPSEGCVTAAQETGLSITTIQRIFSVTQVLGRDEMTTQELAAALKVTVANANRFLNALERAGFAKVISAKKSYSKGRPSRIYKLLIPA